MSLGFAKDPGDLLHGHLLSVAQPERLKLHFRQKAACACPNGVALFFPGQQFGRVIQVGLIRQRCGFLGRRGAVAIDALAPGNREKPGGKGFGGVKLRQGFIGLHEGVLRDFERIGGVRAGAEHKGIDAVFVAGNQFLESVKRAGLAFASQVFV